MLPVSGDLPVAEPAIRSVQERVVSPGGARTLTARDPTREPNGTFWFGAELGPDGDQVWFRIAEEAIGRMPEKTPRARGARLVDALIVWITPDRQLGPGLNRFEVRVSEAGDTWIERLRWRDGFPRPGLSRRGGARAPPRRRPPRASSSAITGVSRGAGMGRSSIAAWSRW